MTQFCGQTVASYWEIKNQKKFPIDSWNQFCKVRKRIFHYLRSVMWKLKSEIRLKSEARNPKPEIRNQKSEIRNQKSEIGNRKSEISNQQSAISNQQSEIGNRKSEIGNRKSEIRNQKSEIGNKITSHLRDVGYYVGSTHNALYPTILSCMWGGGRKGGGEGMTEWESFRTVQFSLCRGRRRGRVRNELKWWWPNSF